MPHIEAEKRQWETEQQRHGGEMQRQSSEQNSGYINWNDQAANTQGQKAATNYHCLKKPGSFADLKFPDKVLSSICVYRYWLLQVEPINVDVFNSLYCGGTEYSLFPTVLDNGDVILTHDGTDVCKLLDKREMVADWAKRSDTMIFRISSCNPDKYGVAAAFYRDEAKRLGNKPNSIVKLTNYASEEKQISISCCSDGQKLACYEDDDGKRVYVSDLFSGGVIGYLPAKYAAMYLDSGFTGIFFDHSETDDEREREVPFVKIYP